MANVTYLIGAGASAGKRGQDNSILEGLPCVNEIPNRLGDYVHLFGDTSVPDDVWTNSNIGLNSKLDWESTKQRLLSDFQQLHKQCVQHATIDTYAKKLILRKEMQTFQYLEQLLTLFFMFEQIQLKPDSRYDTFLANILDNQLQIPSNIHIISWNYDSQFELAYFEYNPSGLLNIGTKRDKETKDYNIIKINGTASFQKQDTNLSNMREEIKKQLSDISKAPTTSSVYQEQRQALLKHIIYNYHLYIVGRQQNTNLSFAFDNYSPSETIYSSIDNIVRETDTLVIIGYTFPFFNRGIDRRILYKLKPYAKIYIQDLNPQYVKQNLQAALTEAQRNIRIEELERTDQFYLPPEL